MDGMIPTGSFPAIYLAIENQQIQQFYSTTISFCCSFMIVASEVQMVK